MDRPVPTVTHSNAWRWGEYPRPPEVDSRYGDAKEARSSTLEEQVRLKKTSGFPGGNADVGHAVAWQLRKHFKSQTTIQLAAHLAAVQGPYNFQGNLRLSRWLGVSDRTVRRHRLILEQKGWIKSYLLLPGDKVLGQKWAVTRPRIVRDASKLQRLANVRASMRYAPTTPRGSKPRRPSAAEVPRPAPPPPGPSATADELDAIAQRLGSGNPLGKQLAAIAAAKRAREPKPVKVPPGCDPNPMDPDELDRIDRELAELTELHEQGKPPPLPRYPRDD